MGELFTSFAVLLALAAGAKAGCGDSTISDDGKTQTIGSCADSSATDTNVTLAPGVAQLDLTGVVYLANLDGADNANLTTITAPNLRIVHTMSLRNLPKLVTIDMPDLFTVFNVEYDGIGNASMPLFVEIREDFKLAETGVETLTAYSGEIHDLDVSGNDDLTTLSFPKLRQLSGNLLISGNSQLTDLGAAFPVLEEIDGTVQIYGNISSIKFPTMKLIKQGLEINGSLALDCDGFLDSLKKLRASTDTVRCNRDSKYAAPSPGSPPTSTPSASGTAGSRNPGATSQSGGSSSASADSGGNSSNKAIGIGIGVGLGVPILLAILAFVLWRRRRSHGRGRLRSSPREKNEAGQGKFVRLESPSGAFHEQEDGDRLSQMLQFENPHIPRLSGCQVQRTGSKFREQGLRSDSEEEL